MPGPGRDRHQIELLHVADFVTHQAFATAAQDHHGVRVFVTFQCRISAGIHFEIAQFAGQRVLVEQHLAGDVLERRAAILLVRLVRDAVPAEVRAARAGNWAAVRCPSST